MKKVLSALLGASILLGSAGLVFATTPQIVQLPTLDASSTPYTANITTQNLNGSTVWLMGYDPTTGAPMSYYINSGLYLNGSTSGGFGELDITNLIGMDKIVGLVGFQTDANTSMNSLWSYLGSATSSMTTNTSDISTLTSNLSSLTATVAGLGPAFNLQSFMTNNASTSIYVASSTKNGFMSSTQAAKLDATSTSTRSMATTTRSIITGTGATGFQVSSTRDAEVRYSTTIVTTSNIAGSQNGTVVLEIAATNSATSTDWTELGRCTNGTAYTLAVAIQGVSTQACQIIGYVPSGFFAKIRSINNAGTPSFTYNSGQEILQ